MKSREMLKVAEGIVEVNKERNSTFNIKAKMDIVNGHFAQNDWNCANLSSHVTQLLIFSS